MKLNKNRMHIKALKNTIKNNKRKNVITEANLRELFYSEKLEKKQYKDRLQMACDCIASELDSNDALRAIFLEAKVIKYNGPDHMRVMAKERVSITRCLIEEVTPEKMDFIFIHKFHQFLVDNYDRHSGFGKLYNVEHNGKRQCLFLDKRALLNVPSKFIIDEYLTDLVRGIKEQIN